MNFRIVQGKSAVNFTLTDIRLKLKILIDHRRCYNKNYRTAPSQRGRAVGGVGDLVSHHAAHRSRLLARLVNDGGRR